MLHNTLLSKQEPDGAYTLALGGHITTKYRCTNTKNTVVLS